MHGLLLRTDHLGEDTHTHWTPGTGENLPRSHEGIFLSPSLSLSSSQFTRKPNLKDDRHGLIFRSFLYLFDLLKQQKDTHFILKASFLEIYNEKVIDLLNPGTARKPLAVRWSKKSRSFFVENLFTVDCEELDDLVAVLEEGE